MRIIGIIVMGIGLVGCTWSHDFRGKEQPEHFNFTRHHQPVVY